MNIDYENYETNIIVEKKRNIISNCLHRRNYIKIYNYSLYAVKLESYHPTEKYTTEYPIMTKRGNRIIKRQISISKYDNYVFVSAYIYFSKLFDNRKNIDDCEKGKIYFFKNKKMKRGEIYNLKTKEINNIITKMFYNDEFKNFDELEFL